MEGRVVYELVYEETFKRDMKTLAAAFKPLLKRRLEWLAENAQSLGHVPLIDPRFADYIASVSETTGSCIAWTIVVRGFISSELATDETYIHKRTVFPSARERWHDTESSASATTRVGRTETSPLQ